MGSSETIKDKLERIRNNLEIYRDTWLEGKNQGRPRPCIVFPDGDTIGMGLASRMSGDPGRFKELGFKTENFSDSGAKKFYSLPKEKRNEFLDEGQKIFDKLFEDVEDLEKLSETELTKKYEELQKKLEKLANSYLSKSKYIDIG